MRLGEPGDLANPSFLAVLRRDAPDLLPRGDGAATVPHVEGTTVLALVYDNGVVMAGDRRATSGNVISKRDMRKVFEADSWSAIAIAGAAGPAIELAKVFATELEFYEKVNRVPLSLEGKATRLATMVRDNLPMALQGFVVVPLFAGYDPRSDVARIYEFDAAGGRYEERRFATNGSGGRDARGRSRRATATGCCRTRRSTWRCRHCGTPRTRTRRPAVPTWSARSTRWSP